MNQIISNQTPEGTISETKAGIIVRLKGKPGVMYRPITKDKLMQDISMMNFQQQVMKEARAALRAKSLDVIKNNISVEIEIISLQSPQSMNLEKVLKAIFDGLNKHIISNDRLISHAQIWLTKGRKRYPKTVIKVRVEDLTTSSSINFRVNLPPIEKKDAVVYNIGAQMDYDPQAAADMMMIERTFKANSLINSKRYEICHMLFYTNDLNKDVDNMFLAYISFVRQQGYLDCTNNIGIGMYKRYADMKDEQTIISLVSK